MGVVWFVARTIKSDELLLVCYWFKAHVAVEVGVIDNPWCLCVVGNVPHGGWQRCIVVGLVGRFDLVGGVWVWRGCFWCCIWWYNGGTIDRLNVFFVAGWWWVHPQQSFGTGVENTLHPIEQCCVWIAKKFGMFGWIGSFQQWKIQKIHVQGGWSKVSHLVGLVECSKFVFESCIIMDL